MITVLASVFVPYFFYYYSGGPDFGARYWYFMIIPLVVLTIRGIAALQKKLAAAAVSHPEGRVWAAVGLLVLLALINYSPWRAIDKYYHFWGMRPDVRELAQDYDFGRSLILVRGDSHPDYVSATVYNPLDLNANAPIYAWDRDRTTQQALLAAYPDRPVWILNGPTITGRGFEVAAGPLTPGQVQEAPR